jgi:hypothetical protein
MVHSLTAGRSPPDRGALERSSSGEGARMPRRQTSRLANNSNSSSHHTMSAEARQTLTARHAGSTTPNQQATSNSSTAEDVEKNVEILPKDKNTISFLQRARGKHLKHIPTIRQSLFAVLTQSCTFRRHPTWVWGTSADCSRAQSPFRVFTVILDWSFPSLARQGHFYSSVFVRI